MTMYTFQAGKGINANKINSNFTELKNQANTNENNLTTLTNTALKKDGSNLTDSIIKDFQKQTSVLLSGSGIKNLLDNTVYYFNPTGDTTFVLPSIGADNYSHTICVFIAGNNYTINLGTSYHIYNDLNIYKQADYFVMFFYNKINQKWYYSITQ